MTIVYSGHDSVVGSFKFSDSLQEKLLIQNSVETKVVFEPHSDNTFNIVFTIERIKILSGAVSLYKLLKRTYLTNSSQWSDWEVILEKETFINRDTIENLNETSSISNTSFLVNGDKYQFKVEFYNAYDELGTLNTYDKSFVFTGVDTIDPELLEAATEITCTFPDTNGLNLMPGDIINISSLATNLPVLSVAGNKVKVSLYPCVGTGIVALTKEYVLVVTVDSVVTINPDPILLVIGTNDNSVFIPSELQLLDSIYAVPLVRYGDATDASKYYPYINGGASVYNPVAYQLTDLSCTVKFSLPTFMDEFSGNFTLPPYDTVYTIKEDVTLIDISDANKLTKFTYLNDVFYKKAYIKVYVFIPTDYLDPDAVVDKYPIYNSILGDWYFKEQFKLDSATYIDTTTLAIVESGKRTTVKYKNYKINIFGLPAEKRNFYIWLGIGFKTPQDIPDAVARIPNGPPWKFNRIGNNNT